MRPKPIVLAVIDGWGVAPPWGGNAISLAKTPFLNSVKQTFPYSTLEASGIAVGLPKGERGNSEVGHLTIGSGQAANESLPAVNASIKDQTFFSNPALVEAFDRATRSGKAVHILGLVSDGGIHSHIDHLYALLGMAAQRKCTNLCIHAFTDGRDTAPFVSQEHLSRLNEKLRQIGFGCICTVSGRYYAMDRDHRWDRIEKTYRAMTEGVGPTARTAEAAVAASYRDGFSDEFIIPTVIQGDNNSFQPIQDGDSIIFFNFRGDRARELTQALVKKDFTDFSRPKTLQNLYFVGFTYYQEGLPIVVAFRPRNLTQPLSAVLSKANLKQLHVAESEKYAHVTYFFNAGSENAFPGEERVVVPSPKVPSYDQVPQMATSEVAQAVIKGLGQYDFIILNFAAPDMVGHTGNLRAAIQACEVVDEALKNIYEAMDKQNGLLIVTADHGNVEQMVNPKTGEPDTEHTNNPVPLHFIGELAKGWSVRAGSLSDLAPTILGLMGLPPSSEMTGKNLIVIPESAPSVVAAPVVAQQLQNT
ncbi:MAG: 2,3-bisphosphoglycerate-independent phosphoglycerate mutase [Patescibacteria group bacterium]